MTHCTKCGDYIEPEVISWIGDPYHQRCAPASGKFVIGAAPPAAVQRHTNFLREVSSAWQTRMNDDEVTCHSRMVEGVLCRWWGDGPTPKGVAMIDSIAHEPCVSGGPSSAPASVDPAAAPQAAKVAPDVSDDDLQMDLVIARALEDWYEAEKYARGRRGNSAPCPPTAAVVRAILQRVADLRAALLQAGVSSVAQAERGDEARETGADEPFSFRVGSVAVNPTAQPAQDVDAGDALKDLRLLAAFAYGNGYHELGYDPVAFVANRLTALQSQVAEQAHEIELGEIARRQWFAEAEKRMRAAEAERDAAFTHVESFAIVLKERDATITRLQESHTKAWNASVADGKRAEAQQGEIERGRELLRNLKRSLRIIGGDACLALAMEIDAYLSNAGEK